MSKKQKKNKKAFKYQTLKVLPKLGQIKTEWDLHGLYYKNEKDPQIEKDLKNSEKIYRKFCKKWLTNDFTSNSKELKKALIEFEKIVGNGKISKPGRYYALRSALNTNDSIAQKQQALLAERFRKMNDQLLFFKIKLGKVSKKKQEEFLKDNELKHFRYYLVRVFLSAQYHLSESEEKIISLKARQSYGMWVDAVEKIVSNRTVSFKKRELHIPEALETLDLLNVNEKKKLWILITDEMEKISEIAEHEFNAIILDASTEDDLRGYKKPYSATVLSYEDDEKSVENLVQTVSDKGFRLSQKFYKLKAQYHGLEKLHYTQKYQSIGIAPSISFKESVVICRDVFYGLKPEYGQIFDNMLIKGQIDVYPKPGKRGGAFMSESTGNPTHVFLNHLDNFKSLETLAHEMGHAIHAERGKSQTPFYQGHSVTTAETVSTLFENLLFDAVYEQAQPKEKQILIHDRIARDIATIQRQIACFNCELEFHNTIKAQGAMTALEMRDVMFKHLKAYLGPAISLDPNDGYSYVYWSHLRYGFYVYTYTFGILMSTIMANNYKADKSYIEQIDKFMCAGESKNVADVFKSIGIDTSKHDTFSEALKNHESDISEFEKFTKTKQK